jgi:hypothetical protein
VGGNNRKPEAKIESKTSLMAIQQQQIAQTTPAKQTVNTGILKPMAAIKGTTKPICESEKKTSPVISEKPPVISEKPPAGFAKGPVIFRPALEARNELQVPQNSPVRVKSDQNVKKFNTVPSKLISTSITTTIYEEEKEITTVTPMRPLLRGYNNHLTLPSRIRQLGQMNEFADGYCSDGDSLRKKQVKYVDNIESGYLSEGGGCGGSSYRQQFLNSMRTRSQLPTTIEER